MQNDEKMKIAKSAVKQGVNGGIIASAAGIVSGAAMTTVTTATPVTALWGLITVGTTTVAAPVIIPGVLAACAVGGAVVGGTAAAVSTYRYIKKTNDDFEKMKNGD